ncbi:MAG: glutamate racemase [Zetaproteobacteria bacterium]|nr:glutamate racemase [Zetaproteobacteria bacterium]
MRTPRAQDDHNINIGVLDSGIGGLSILQEVCRRFPAGLNCVYLADHAYFPYGNKPSTQISTHLQQLCPKFAQYYQLDALILACNSASTHALDTVRQQLQIPVIGVVPAIKPAAKLSRSGTIAVLATEATIQSRYTQDLITQFASHCQVHLLAPAGLVELCEQSLQSPHISIESLKHILTPLWQLDKVDTVVLACTHFPLIQAQLNQLSISQGKHYQWQDSGAAIAARIDSLLQVQSHTPTRIQLLSTRATGSTQLQQHYTHNPLLAGIRPYVTEVSTFDPEPTPSA